MSSSYVRTMAMVAVALVLVLQSYFVVSAPARRSGFFGETGERSFGAFPYNFKDDNFVDWSTVYGRGGYGGGGGGAYNNDGLIHGGGGSAGKRYRFLSDNVVDSPSLKDFSGHGGLADESLQNWNSIFDNEKPESGFRLRRRSVRDNKGNRRVSGILLNN